MADTDQQQQQSQDPTAEQMMAVSTAGATATQEGGDAAAAMKEKRDEIGLTKLDDDTIEQLATILHQKHMEGMRAEGAFDPPPEPVQAPEQPTAPPGPGEPQSAEPVHQPAPAKRTPAHRFLGID